MEATPVQNIIPVAPAANAANGAAANSAAACEANAPGAAQTPRGFGALLALQLGGAAKSALKSDAGAEHPFDEKTAADPAATAATVTPLDPLAGLNLPALTPLAMPVVAAPAGHAAAPAAANEAPAGAHAPATTLADATLPRAASDKGEPAIRTTEPAIAVRGEASAFAREIATVKTAVGGQTTEPVTHTGETRTPDAAQVAQLQLNAAPAPAPAAPAQAAIAARVGTPDWNTELGQQIVWMVGDKQQVAELHVNPPELGPLDIKLTIDGSQTTAVFTSPHSEVREAVESALPRLREVLADSGLTLGNASVTADTPRDSQAFDRPSQNGRTGERNAADAAPAAAPPLRTVRAARGMVDLFA